MAAGERIRLFCALPLPERTVEQIVRWQDGAFPPGRIGSARRVAPANLHVTLAFLGSRPVADLPAVRAALGSAVAGAGPVRLTVRGYRETRSVGMLTFDDEGGRGAEVARRLQALLEASGLYRGEARPWLPHVTVLRFREPPRLRPVLPGLGQVSPSDAAAYSSVLQPGGAQYAILERIALMHV